MKMTKILFCLKSNEPSGISEDVRCMWHTVKRSARTCAGGVGLQGLADGGAAPAAGRRAHRAVRLRALRPSLDDAQLLDISRTVTTIHAT